MDTITTSTFTTTEEFCDQVRECIVRNGSCDVSKFGVYGSGKVVYGYTVALPNAHDKFLKALEKHPGLSGLSRKAVITSQDVTPCYHASGHPATPAPQVADADASGYSSRAQIQMGYAGRAHTLPIPASSAKGDSKIELEGGVTLVLTQSGSIGYASSYQHDFCLLVTADNHLAFNSGIAKEANHLFGSRYRTFCDNNRELLTKKREALPFDFRPDNAPVSMKSLQQVYTLCPPAYGELPSEQVLEGSLLKLLVSHAIDTQMKAVPIISCFIGTGGGGWSGRRLAYVVDGACRRFRQWQGESGCKSLKLPELSFVGMTDRDQGVHNAFRAEWNRLNSPGKTLVPNSTSKGVSIPMTVDHLKKIGTDYAAPIPGGALSLPGNKSEESCATSRELTPAGFDPVSVADIKILDDSGFEDTQATARAQRMLSPIMKGGDFKLATADEIADLDGDLTTSVTLDKLSEYKQGGILKYKLGSEECFDAVDDIVACLDGQTKFTKQTNKGLRDVLRLEGDVVVSCIGKSMVGDCPPGKMTITHRSEYVDGYKSSGSFRIEYNIPAYKCPSEHSRAGKTIPGTIRVCYLPDNDDFREVLLMLMQAWTRKLIFTIGNSSTTGATDQIVWNDIHHKTRYRYSDRGHSFPDPNYLRNVKDELSRQGVGPEDIKGVSLSQAMGTGGMRIVLGPGVIDILKPVTGRSSLR